MSSSRRTPLTDLAYARNAAHQRFALTFDGQLKGRYPALFLRMAGILGGAHLRAEIERELGRPRYEPDQWVPVHDAVVIFDRAVRAGVSLEGMGELVMPTYREANPTAFEGRSVGDAFDLLEKAYRQDTSYGGVSPGLKLGSDRASVFRRNSVLPCPFFVGVIKGLLRMFGVRGEAAEVECQWDGKPNCRFDATWNATKKPG